MSKFYKQFDVGDLNDLQSTVIEIIKKINVKSETHPFMTFLKRQNLIQYYKEINETQSMKKLLYFFNWEEHILDFVIATVPPGTSIPPHYDIIKEGENNTTNVYRLLVPIKNCENVKTSFYSSKKLPVMKTAQRSDGKVEYYPEYDKPDCILEDFFLLNKPTVLNTSYIHGVENDTMLERINLWIIPTGNADTKFMED